MPSGKFVRIAISDGEHVDDAALADFDIEDWKQERIQDQRQKIIKTNGSILSIALACGLFLVLVVCLLIAILYQDPLCKNRHSPNQVSLQYFLFYDSAVVGFCFILTIGGMILSHFYYPQYTIKFVQISGSIALLGLFSIQVVECIAYGKLFISTDSFCPLPVATVTIVMNLLFFGGPLLVFCCFAVGRSSTITFAESGNNGTEDENNGEEEEEGEELELELEVEGARIDEETEMINTIV